MRNTAFVGSSLDGSILDLARMKQPVCQKENSGDAESQDHENGHGKGGVENFNVRHSGPKDSKKLFAVNPEYCKVYLWL